LLVNPFWRRAPLRARVAKQQVGEIKPARVLARSRAREAHLRVEQIKSWQLRTPRVGGEVFVSNADLIHSCARVTAKIAKNGKSVRPRVTISLTFTGFLDIQIGITLIHAALRNRPARFAAARTPRERSLDIQETSRVGFAFR